MRKTMSASPWIIFDIRALFRVGYGLLEKAVLENSMRKIASASSRIIFGISALFRLGYDRL